MKHQKRPKTHPDHIIHFGTVYECPTQKRAYQTRADAKRQAKLNARNGGDLLRVYRCPHCDRIHLGHLPPAGRP